MNVTSSFIPKADVPVLVTADSPLFHGFGMDVGIEFQIETDATSADITFVTTKALTIVQ